MPEKLNKIECFYPIVLFVGRKNQLLLKKELHIFNNIPNDYVKMNKIINKFLMTGDKELQPNLKM